MSTFKNNPKLINVAGKMYERQFTHQPLTFDHFDIHCSITANGKVNLKRLVPGSDEYDEIEIPASLAFKLVNHLKDTRTESFVEVDESGKPVAAPSSPKAE